MKNVWTLYKKVWKFIVLIFLTVLTFSYAMFQGGFVSWFLFYSFFPFVIYCAAISFYPLKQLEVTRELPKTDYNAGEPLKVTVTVRRRHSFPLFFLIIGDRLDGTLQYSPQQKPAKALLIPGMKREFSYDYMIDELPRGEHNFHSISLRMGDPLGLFEKERTISAENKIIVYPAISELVYHPFEHQYDQGMTSSRELVQNDTSMAIGVRDYQPGDRFSWINWKASAKRNEMMTKEFEQRQSHDVIVIMDCIHDPRFEAIVSFTASLLHVVIKKGAQAGLLTFSDENSSFPIRGGEKQLREFFYHLAKIKAKSSYPFEKVLETESLFVQQTVSFILVTARLTKPLIERSSFPGRRRGTVTLFLIKRTNELPAENERMLIAMANARGIRIVTVHEGNFAAAFSEVKMR